VGVEVDLQAAIYARLSDQIVGGGKDCQAVYDYPPEGATYPYVTFGEMQFPSEDAQTRNRFNVLVRLHTWSRSGSSRETKVIQGDIYAALHDYDLTVLNDAGGAAEWLCYSLLRDVSFAQKDPDGTIHGVCEYRALVQSA
jgi:hypothetical protein